MKKTIWILAGTLIFGSAAWADSACASGFLDSYLVANFSCHIDNLDFTNWSYQAAGTTHIAASSISVSPITVLLDEGFTFNPGIQVSDVSGGGPFNEDVLVGFTVSTVDKSKTIHDLSINFNGSFTGDGSTNFTETWNSPPCGTCSFTVQNPPKDLVEHIVLANLLDSLTITKDVSGATGTSGTASVSKFVNQFSQVVPEPAYTGLLAAGLLGLGWLRKRRQSQV